MAELYEQLGLTRWEYERICDLQGREPTHVELAVFSLMWSEHCGYKHSKPLLSVRSGSLAWFYPHHVPFSGTD